MKEILVQILTMLGVLGIPSFVWNIFLYKQNKKYKKWDANKNLQKLYIQKTIVKDNFERNTQKVYENYENRTLDFDTDSERAISLEKELGLLQEKENNDLWKIDADIDYFEKIRGQEKSFSFLNLTLRQKIKKSITKLWQKLNKNIP